MPGSAYESKEDEYWYNVSPQDHLPLAGEVDLDIDLHCLSEFFLRLSAATDDSSAKRIIVDTLKHNPQIFGHARQFLGLSDKRAYLELSYRASRTPHPTQATSLTGCHPWTLTRHPMGYFLRLLGGSQGTQVQTATADMMAAYLMQQGLLEAATGFSAISEDLMRLVYTRLIATREYQQRAAKRRGHGCEAALARVLEECGIDILPENKAANPMGATDPHLDLETLAVSERRVGETHSFDILILSDDRVLVAIQSLIHTSDPGQYGVDKSNETVEIAEKIRAWNDRHRSETPVELWGLVDGVGFSENKPDTINKLLREFDYFLQLRTLYKAPLRLHQLGQTRLRAVRFSEYYDPEDVSAIASLYGPEDLTVLTDLDEAPTHWLPVDCGEAVVFL